MNGEGARITGVRCYLMSELGTQFYIWSGGRCGWLGRFGARGMKVTVRP
jgi:hypothetical protein